MPITVRAEGFKGVREGEWRDADILGMQYIIGDDSVYLLTLFYCC